jgi:hypothetical protein
MENTSGKKGRPPAIGPGMPLFFGMARGRVKEAVIMSATTAKELRSYIDWASGLMMMIPDDEVMVRIADYALVEYFKRDTAWRKDRAEFFGEAKSATPSAPGTAPAKTGGAPSPTSMAADRSAPRPATATAAVPAPGTGHAANKVG